MKAGDRVKVVRVDDYSEQIRELYNARSPLGMVGVVEEIYYNPNMHREEVVIAAEGSKWIFEPRDLMKVGYERRG